MRKYGFFIFVMMLALTVQAQDKSRRVKEIRKAYAKAKQDIDGNGRDGQPRMDMTITLNDGVEVADGDFINDLTETRFYFNRIRPQAETDLFEPRCYFIVQNATSNGHTWYREMLFNPFSEQLVFSFMKVETHTGFVIESRYYYDDEGRLIDEKHLAGSSETTAEGQSWSSSEGDQTIAVTYIGVFNDLMQQKGASAEDYDVTPTAEKTGRTKQIRGMYAEAKQRVARDATSGLPRNIQIEIHDQEDPGIPPQKDVLKFWFDLTSVEETAFNSCYFMSTTTDLGDHHVYSEYLFDPKTARLAFCFSQQQQNEGPALEWRYYFDSKGRCVEKKGQGERYGPGFADRKFANSYLNVFNALANPSM